MSVEEILSRSYSRLLVADKETGRFSARVIEFSGCFADGATADEAALNLERAAAAWVEAVLRRGQQIPEPVGDSE